MILVADSHTRLGITYEGHLGGSLSAVLRHPSLTRPVYLPNMAIDREDYRDYDPSFP